MTFNQPQMLDQVLHKVEIPNFNIGELPPESRTLLLKVMTPDVVYYMLAFVRGAYIVRSSL